MVPVSGEIDIANSGELGARLVAASGHGRLVAVDLRAVTFIDASGLTALLDGHRAAVERGGSLVLVNVPPAVSRVLRIAAVDSVLHIESR